MPKIYTPDLSLTEIKNFLVHKIAGNPASPVDAQGWYDTTANRVKVRVNGVTKTLAHLDEIISAVFGTATTSAVGDTATAGSGSQFARDNHVHGREAFGTPGSSAVGDSAAAGSATTDSRSDHVHGREAFGAVSAQTTFGAASANGTATTETHSDHTHGTPTHDAAAHSAISLSSLSAPTGNLAIGSNKLTGVLDGTANSDAATVGQMNALVQGLEWKDDVVAATTANGTLATAYANGQVIDGVTLATNDRILIKNQTTGADNGIYIVNASGAPTRATDADTATKIQGAATIVRTGTLNADTAWYLSTDAITLGTTAQVWNYFPGGGAITATAPIVKTGNVISFTAASATGTGGPGGGLTSAGAVDTGVTCIKYASTFGDGAASSFTITHGLGSKDVHVQVRNVSDDKIEFPDVTCTSTTQVTIDYGSVVPANAGKRVVVVY